MTFFKTTTPLDLDGNFFDSAETEILSMAFEKAWAFVEFDPMLGVLEAPERQSQLACCLMALLKLGETDPTSLANAASLAALPCRPSVPFSWTALPLRALAETDPRASAVFVDETRSHSKLCFLNFSSSITGHQFLRLHRH